jgi:phage tail sheath protein FI
MAETLLSPGVLTRENDQSQITQGPITAGAAIIGPTVSGPVRIPTLVTSYSDYLNKFGGSFISGGTSYEYLTSISTYNYFQQGGTTLLVTRAVSGTFLPATSSATNNIASIVGGFASASFVTQSSSTASWNQILITSNTAFGDIKYTIYNYPYYSTGSYSYDSTGNTLYVGIGNGNNDGVNAITSTSQWATLLINAINASGSTGTEISSLVSASLSGSSIKFTSTNAGTVYNNLALTSSFGYGTPVTSSFRGGTDSTPNTVFVLETLSQGDINNSFSTEGTNNTLLSGSNNNIRYELLNVSTGSGTFDLLIRRGNDNINSKVVLEQWTGLSLDPNQPNYIEAMIGNQSTTTDNGYTQVTGDYTNKSRYVRVKSVAYTTPNYFDNNGTPVSSYTASLPIAQSGSFGGALGVNCAVYGLSNSDYTSSITLLSNPDEYKFNIITTPGITATTGNAVITSLTNMASDRGDCIAIVDMSAFGNNIATVINNATSVDSSYAATYYPWVQISAPNTGKLTWVPPSTIIPSVYAYNDRIGAPWFAPAGFTRGGLSVIQAERKLSPSDRDALYAGKINSLATFPGQGVVAYGQKTLQKKASALDRINVRRLLIELKSYIGQIADGLVFEQNTAATRNRFLRQVNPYLDSIQQRQGVYAYKVVMDESNNTADVIDRNQLLGQIFIQPTRTAEFIILDFNVTPTGATFA